VSKERSGILRFALGMTQNETPQLKNGFFEKFHIRLRVLFRLFTGRSPVRTLTTHSSPHHEMKIVRTVLLICALVGSLVPPIFFLTVRHFHLEGEAAEWMVSLWPRSLGEVALEDRRAMADMLITYGELAGATMLTYSVIGWSVVFLWRSFKRAGARDPSLRSG
jgi:hypothetical protein